jgi:chemotaxis protein methyltransferase CheR
MYFSKKQAENVIHRLYLSLNENGWLIVSPSELSQTLFATFMPVTVNNMFFYRKTRTRSDTAICSDAVMPAAIMQQFPTEPESQVSCRNRNNRSGISENDRETITESPEEQSITENIFYGLDDALKMYNCGCYEEQ